MNLGREVGEVISINSQTLSWASKSFSNSLFSFFIADCLSPSVSVKCPFHCYTYHHVVVYMTHSQMLGKFEYTGGPIFKVVLEC